MDVLPAAGEWTEADYYPLSERGRLVELSDGNIEVIELPIWFHQLILLRLAVALQSFVSNYKLGWVAFAPLPVRLWPGKIREPDLMFMSTAHRDRIGLYWGIPDLAVEILSSSTAAKDREVKRVEYAQAGVVEYWIIDPEAKSIEVLTRSEQSSVYDRSALFRQTETLVSGLLPGLALSLTDLFADELSA
jgi:Uma2 family endonuclease